jgi:AcrR family transcriptional regulator
MSKAIKKPVASPRERIMNVASDLFYRQGYRATGINEVIEISGVAKATFYSHFPSKEDLCAAYLSELRDAGITTVDRAIAAAKSPLERFMAPIKSLKPWLLNTEFRGCAFLNIASEIPEPKHPLRKLGPDFYDAVGDRVRGLARELIDSEPKRFAHLNVKDLTRDYMLAFTGSTAQAELYHAIWPIEHAIATVQRLIGE